VGIVYLGDRRRPPTIDQERCPLGHGELPLAEIIHSLLDAGYTGWFDVRLLVPEFGTDDYWGLLKQSQQAVAQMVPATVPRSLA
jgi:sugar phosphate isomerase/epimerase